MMKICSARFARSANLAAFVSGYHLHERKGCEFGAVRSSGRSTYSAGSICMSRRLSVLLTAPRAQPVHELRLLVYSPKYSFGVIVPELARAGESASEKGYLSRVSNKTSFLFWY
jgi:hypothetical protein